MGSPHPALAEAAPQQELPPVVTRCAACAYLSFTTSLISGLMPAPLSTKLDDGFRLKCLVTSAALGIEELQKFLKRSGVGGVVQECALTADLDQAFRLELVQMMRERGVRYVELVLDFANNEAFGMG